MQSPSYKSNRTSSATVMIPSSSIYMFSIKYSFGYSPFLSYTRKFEPKSEKYRAESPAVLVDINTYLFYLHILFISVCNYKLQLFSIITLYPFKIFINSSSLLVSSTSTLT